jgi:hypothetical protein
MVISGSTIYVSGDFQIIGGQARRYLAALDIGTGQATSWNPRANDIVEPLAVSGTSLYVGGLFTRIGGQTRNRIAALDTTTGLATAWNPDADWQVRDLLARNNSVYVTGTFTHIGGQTRPYLAELDASTGMATAWGPRVSGSLDISPVDIYILVAAEEAIYIGGWFDSVNGRAHSNLAALSTRTFQSMLPIVSR